MSSFSSILPPVTSATSTSTGSATASNPLGNMSPMDFVNLLVTQLQNQDPLNPTSTSDLLTQVSQIGQLQSSTQLQTTLTGLNQNNQIAAASSLIGKQVTGIDAANNTTQGVVTSVAVSSNGVTLQLDSGDTLSLTNVSAIADAPAAATTSSPLVGPTQPTQ